MKPNLKFPFTMKRTSIFLSCLMIIITLMVSCENENVDPITEKDARSQESASNKAARSSGTYSSISGPGTTCPVQVLNYSYTWNNYNFMIPKGATLTVTGGVFLPSGSTTLNIPIQVGTTNFQVQWNSAGSITATGRWESGASAPPRPQYQEVITKTVTVSCP